MIKNNSIVPVRVYEKSSMMVFFYDSRNIYLQNLKSPRQHLHFHRNYVHERNFYSKKWKPFRMALFRAENMDLSKIYRLAEEYEIDVDGQELPAVASDKSLLLRRGFWSENYRKGKKLSPSAK